MNANDFRTLVTNYTSNENEVFDKIADNFLIEAQKEFEKAIIDGTATDFFGASKICIAIHSINTFFLSFKLSVTGWNLHHNEDICEKCDIQTYDEFIATHDLSDVENDYHEFAGFQDVDIILLKPFVKALQRKGFECYLADYDCSMLVAFDI